VSEPINTKEVVTALLDGLDVKSRADGTVHSVRANGRTVAEVCVGSRKVRVNVKSEPSKGMPKSITLEGKSKTWAGGGINVDKGNVRAAHALLAAVVAAASAAKGKQAEPTAADAARVSRKATGRPQADARARRGPAHGPQADGGGVTSRRASGPYSVRRRPAQAGRSFALPASRQSVCRAASTGG